MTTDSRETKDFSLATNGMEIQAIGLGMDLEDLRSFDEATQAKMVKEAQAEQIKSATEAFYAPSTEREEVAPEIANAETPEELAAYAEEQGFAVDYVNDQSRVAGQAEERRERQESAATDHEDRQTRIANATSNSEIAEIMAEGGLDAAYR